MIKYNSSSYIDTIFRLKGSVFKAVLPMIIVTALISVGVGILDASVGPILVNERAFSLLILALGFLLVFRSNLSYGRYWEGRGHLGLLVYLVRDLSRQMAFYIQTPDSHTENQVKNFNRYLKIYFALVRMHLRSQISADEVAQDEVGKLLTDSEKAKIATSPRKPLIILGMMSSIVYDLAHRGHLSDLRFQRIDKQLGELIVAFNGLDKIKGTPVPFPYAQMLLIFLCGYCFTCPFMLVQYFGIHTWVPACIITFALFGINAVGLEIEDPFGFDDNDLPVDAMNATVNQDVDINVRVAAEPSS